jgi:hypothetical protein
VPRNSNTVLDSTMLRSKRAFVSAVGGLSCLAFAIALPAVSPCVEEDQLLRSLESDEYAERNAAMQKLVELGSVRAVRASGDPVARLDGGWTRVPRGRRIRRES